MQAKLLCVTFDNNVRFQLRIIITLTDRERQLTDFNVSQLRAKQHLHLHLINVICFSFCILLYYCYYYYVKKDKIQNIMFPFFCYDFINILMLVPVYLLLSPVFAFMLFIQSQSQYHNRIPFNLNRNNKA